MKLKGKLGSEFILAIFINELSSINDESLYQNYMLFANEKIINNTYFYYLPIKLKKTCDPGHFYNRLIILFS